MSGLENDRLPTEASRRLVVRYAQRQLQEVAGSKPCRYTKSRVRPSGGGMGRLTGPVLPGAMSVPGTFGLVAPTQRDPHSTA